MVDRYVWQERRDRLARYQAMEREVTDPLAAGLLHDIVSELEGDLNEQVDAEAQLILMRDLALEPGTIEFRAIAKFW
jgi:HD superfamily phosphodiesterase